MRFPALLLALVFSASVASCGGTSKGPSEAGTRPVRVSPMEQASAPTPPVTTDSITHGTTQCGPDTWETSPVREGAGATFNPVFAVDDAAGAHVTYAWMDRNAQTTVEYAHRPAGGQWTITPFTAARGSGAVATAAGGRVAITLYGPDRDLLVALRGRDGDWQETTVDTEGDAGFLSAIALAPDGAIHVAYYAHVEQEDQVRYATRAAGGTWTTAVIERDLEDLERRLRPTLVLDASGDVHLLYQVARRDDSGWVLSIRHGHRGADGRWAVIDLETGRDGELSVGPSDLTVDQEGGLHLTYHNRGIDPEQGVQYAHRASDGSWSKVPWSWPSHLGSIPIAAEATGRLHAVYLESRRETGDLLHYARQTALRHWNHCTVEATSSLVNEIAVDPMDGVHLLYTMRRPLLSGGTLTYAYRPPNE